MADDKPGFLASIPAIQSAVRITGDGGGVRLTIDVSEMYYDRVMEFVKQARRKSFRLVPLWDETDNEIGERDA
jgi:hypothetical protein